jgi:glycosyltransferase involved in cell wall biosynthesis
VGRSRLAVVIPAHREGGSIGPIVAEAARHANVIVVDDCSPDGTGEQARAAGAIVISSDKPLGYEGAVSRGFDEAVARGFSHAVTMDADGEHDPKLVATFRELLIDRDIPLVLGVRPRKQRISETIMGAYLRARFGVRDILCGMKGYDLALYRANGGFSHHDSIGTELAINSLRRGTRFEQIPVHGTPRADQPRFDRKLRANLRILRALGRVMLDDLRRGP